MTSAPDTTAVQPTPAELRKFGLSTGIAFVVIFGLFLPWAFSFAIPRWPYIVAALLCAPALVAPKVLRPVFSGWMWAAHKIGAFNARVLLTIVFYLVVAPIGLLRRLGRADSLGLRRSNATTYRKLSRSRPPASQERPF
ncbi:MAG: SxtJ family membrane protein [Steroidobacter sp.]